MKITNEAKTGILVVACLAALTLLLFKVGNFQVFKSGYTVKSHFHFTAGVKKHAPVRLSGVDVGEVKAINLLYGDETLIEVTLKLNEGVKLRTDSTAFVTTLGMMGEKYIEIRTGTPSAPWAQDGDMILSEDPIRIEELLKMGKQVANDVSAMTIEIKKLAANINETVTGAKPNIDNIFKNLEETSVNFREFSDDIKYHPWKILARGREVSKEDREKERQTRKARDAGLAESPAPAPAGPKQNFTKR